MDINDAKGLRIITERTPKIGDFRLGCGWRIGARVETADGRIVEVKKIPHEWTWRGLRHAINRALDEMERFEEVQAERTRILAGMAAEDAKKGYL